jgi:hypothetical protein
MNDICSSQWNRALCVNISPITSLNKPATPKYKDDQFNALLDHIWSRICITGLKLNPDIWRQISVCTLISCKYILVEYVFYI